MQTVKALSKDDTHFVFESSNGTKEIDSVKVIVFWNQIDSKIPLPERYNALSKALSMEYSCELDFANTYIILERAAALVSSLKKTLLG